MIKKILQELFRGICFFLPIQKNKIVVSSYYGRGYGDNPKYIIEELLKDKQKLNIIWIVKTLSEKDSLPANVKACKAKSFLNIYHLATARVWIDNCRKSFRYKKKKQVYLQTWHGFALKRIEKDVEGHLGESYVKCAIKDSKNTDIIISDSRFMTGIYQKSFWYNGEIVEWGSPRTDIILNPRVEIYKNVRNYFGVSNDKKIVLYAPTFRADHSIEPYNIDYNRLKESCENRFGDKFVVLVRLHPNIISKCEFLKFKEGEIINATYYPDMQELLVASDICITDYSSLMFDFALSYKPCFQFATDIQDYKKDRNFYFEIDKLPFSVAQNNDELVKNILEFNREKYEEKLLEFYNKVGMIRDGQASRRCAKYILQNLNNKGMKLK